MTVATRFQDARGHTIRLAFPDFAAVGVDAPALAEAIARHQSLARDLATAQVEHQRLLDARPQAVEADRAALGKALAAGRPDPGTKSLVNHDAAVAAQARQVDGYQVAVAEAADAVVAVLDADRDRLLADLDDHQATAADEMAGALDAWAQARERRTRLREVRRWAAAFPSELRFQQGGAGTIPSLIGVNHDPLDAGAVLAALRDDAGVSPT